MIKVIISCKGIQKNHHVKTCIFLHDGNWGDLELIEHEKFHKSIHDNSFWLGFETSQQFGNKSGRDGKRS